MESSGRESAGGASRFVRLRPTDSPTAPSDDLTAIQDEDRHCPLAAELLDLCTVALLLARNATVLVLRIQSASHGAVEAPPFVWRRTSSSRRPGHTQS
jgi:hypothetical protein